MPIVDRPSGTSTMLGGSIAPTPNACRHETPTLATPWTGEPGTAGTVAVIGAGKMGLPLAAQFASHGWNVLAVDIDPQVVASINAGRSHVPEEPGLAGLVESARKAGRLRATLDAAEAARSADVIILIVPVLIDAADKPDRRTMDSAVRSIAPGLRPGTLVILETTLPIGDTRGHYAPLLEDLTGHPTDDGDASVLVAFSPERLYSGAALTNLATYPKLVGGLGPRSRQRAAAFYDSVLDAEIVAMSSPEAAEFAKLADTTYRDVNIALATEFAHVAERVGVDVIEVINAANSQPYSHIHRPGIGVGGHCIPVYPRFLLEGAPDLRLVALARDINDGEVGRTIARLEDHIGSLLGARVLVLGLTYRSGVREFAYSRAIPLIASLRERGADVLAFDPLLTEVEVQSLGVAPWMWGTRVDHVSAVISQTEDSMFVDLDWACFPDLRVVVDGRNSLGGVTLPSGVARLGIGRTA